MLKHARNLFRRLTARFRRGTSKTRSIEPPKGTDRLEILDQFAIGQPDKESALALLKLGGFIATFVKDTGMVLDEEVAARLRTLARLARVYAGQSKVDLPEWFEALWQGRDIYVNGPDEVRFVFAALTIGIAESSGTSGENQRSQLASDELWRARFGFLEADRWVRFLETKFAVLQDERSQSLLDTIELNTLLQGRLPIKVFAAFPTVEAEKAGVALDLWEELLPETATVAIA